MDEKEKMTRFVLQKRAEGRSEATLDFYSYALKDWLQYLWGNGQQVGTAESVLSYFVCLRGKRYSTATIRDKWRALSVFYRWSERNGLGENIMRGMSTPPKEKKNARCFTDEEVRKMLSFLERGDGFCAKRDLAVVCLLLGTGLRRAELLSIVRIDGDYLTVVGKGSKQRSVPIAPVLRERLKPYTEARAGIAHTPYYIVTRDGDRLSKDGLRAIFTRLSRATGIGGRRFSAHTFRHYYATKALANGMDIASLQKVLGHSSLTTTALYLGWTDDMAQEANARANPLLSFFGVFKI